MGLETVTHIQDLNSSWPLGSDLASTADDHLRNIKSALKTDLPNFNGTINSAAAPVLAPAGDTDTGVYYPSANTVGIATGGVQAVNVTSAQVLQAVDQAAALQDVGWRDIPQNGQNGNYTLALSDRGKHILHNGGSGHTITIPTNASVPFPVGTSITIINNTGAGALTISLATDTLVWLPSGTIGGTRTLSGSGYATLIKVFSTQWMLMGAGIT